MLSIKICSSSPGPVFAFIQVYSCAVSAFNQMGLCGSMRKSDKGKKPEMIEELVADVTEYDFMVALETRKPKSWLKSISAYANSLGGMLLSVWPMTSRLLVL